ncbi:hypothetical protein PHYSODRAFT_311437 [Phytophthora sojae]|uniref:Uncharacterized protein n=1 Tax=Phytophthora sojae (strain P6497) TaxID=1094619 RepID=G4YWX9_PHYSP|nr:hypothetical protein PHYSODRAFT_311437 [Phytophthora sojae]EGZ24477.1 hypothetical protein PHYSODRAFT_311437 [Phytophthora sojae]|eukprot:XP_009519765.1 hypothetical protein PHYSODRAFT_311437 [Phytophthora sojae]
MTSIASSRPILATKLHQPTASPFRGLLDRLMGRNSTTTSTLPRSLASASCAASLLSGPLPLDEILDRRHQLQRVVDVVVLDATRDKKNELVITWKLSLRSEAPREQVGIFVPNNAAVKGLELTTTFHDVKQLGRILTFCVENSEKDCAPDCEFCSELRGYLCSHWVRDPLVNVLNMGETVLRKQVMAMHMATLVAFATGKSTVSRVVTTPNEDKGVQLAPRLAPLGGKGVIKSASTCAVQNEVTAVLYDFFDALHA